jgi:hypothetical protein
MQGTLSTTTPQETGPHKQPIIHTVGTQRKDKSHKQIPKYTIIEDDSNLIAEGVHDRVADEFEEVENQRGSIRNELAEIKKVLERIQAT